MFLQTLIVVISPLIFAGLAWYFIKSRKQLQDEERLENSRMLMHDQEIAQDENRLRNESEENKLRGELIVKLSEKIAQDLIIELEQILEKKKDSFTSVVPEGEKFESELTDISAKIKSEYVGKIMEIMMGLEKFEHQKAHNIIEFSGEQYEKTEEDLAKIRAEELSNLKNRIEKYKQEEIKLFDEKVKVIIDTAAKEVLGKALTSSEQQELITKALEEARKKNAL